MECTKEINAKKSITSKATINTKSILTYMASLREKTKEELVLLTKAVQFRQWDNVKL
jgi:Xaa-Pro aminopeptidase